MIESVIVLPDGPLAEKVRNTLNENDEKLINRVELFKEWLCTENHLPKNVDLNYIKNFIRAAKFDILKAKKKFEIIMYAKAKWSDFLNYSRLLNDDVFKFPLHRRATISRRLTKDGYRLISLRFNSKDAQHLCVEHLLAYMYLLGEYLLWKDFLCGIIVIIDFEDFYTEFLAKTNIKMLKMWLDVVIKVMPFSIKNIHFCSLSPASKVLVNITVAMLKEKMRQKVIYHKTSADLKEYIELDDLPKDYGGTADCLEDVGELCKQFFFENRQLVQDIANQKLRGPLPKEKNKYLGEFEEFSTEGSFRKLDID